MEDIEKIKKVISSLKTEAQEREETIWKAAKAKEIIETKKAIRYVKLKPRTLKPACEQLLRC